MSPAHLRSIAHRCDHPACDRPATVQLFNTYNAPCGRYCKRHGETALRDFQRKHEDAR